jgi:hypothetical protein
MSEPTEHEIDTQAWERRIEFMQTFRRHVNVCPTYHGVGACNCGYVEMMKREQGQAPQNYTAYFKVKA